MNKATSGMLKVGGLNVGGNELTGSEFAALDGVTPGAGAASKAAILDSAGNFAMPAGGYFKPSNATPAAAGANQAAATVLAAMVNAVTGADGAKGVALPAAADGLDIWIVNTDPSNALLVYPVNGGNDQINSIAANSPFTLGPGRAGRFHATSATQWYVEDVFASVTASATELNYNDITTLGTAQASKTVTADSNKDITSLRDVGLRQVKTTGNVGTANAGTTAAEYGDGHNHKTVLTVNTTLPAIAGGANLAVGKLLYTLPAGAIIIESAYMSLAITQSQGNITADTPDGGLGTVIGSGAVATLDGTATFEDILTGQTFNDCNGTAEVKTAIPTAGVPLVIEAAGAHTIYFNVADGWAASGDAAALLVGTVVVNWRFVA
jgi:hypothetical protein